MSSSWEQLCWGAQSAHLSPIPSHPTPPICCTVSKMISKFKPGAHIGDLLCPKILASPALSHSQFSLSSHASWYHLLKLNSSFCLRSVSWKNQLYVNLFILNEKYTQSKKNVNIRIPANNVIRVYRKAKRNRNTSRHLPACDCEKVWSPTPHPIWSQTSQEVIVSVATGIRSEHHKGPQTSRPSPK